MRFLLKLILFVVLAPLILGLVILLGVAAMVAVPILWEELVARISSPPNRQEPQS